MKVYLAWKAVWVHLQPKQASLYGDSKQNQRRSRHVLVNCRQVYGKSTCWYWNGETTMTEDWPGTVLTYTDFEHPQRWRPNRSNERCNGLLLSHECIPPKQSPKTDSVKDRTAKVELLYSRGALLTNFTIQAAWSLEFRISNVYDQDNECVYWPLLFLPWEEGKQELHKMQLRNARDGDKGYRLFVIKVLTVCADYDNNDSNTISCHPSFRSKRKVNLALLTAQSDYEPYCFRQWRWQRSGVSH